MGVLIADMAVTGGPKSGLWRQNSDNMFNCNVSTTDVLDNPALGAAMLASWIGVYSSIEPARDMIVSRENI